MFISENFSYNNIPNTEVLEDTLMLVRVGGNSIQKQNFGENRKLSTVYQRKTGEYLLYGKINSPIKFKIQLAKEKAWTEDEKIKVNNWLFQNSYKDFKSEDSAYIYRCMATDGNFYNDSFNRGYAEINFECNSSYAYTDIITRTVEVSGTAQIIYDCKSNLKDVKYKPEIQITLQSGDGFSIINSTNNSSLIFKDLVGINTIYVNNQTYIIMTNNGTNILPNLQNKRFLSLNSGNNILNMTGNGSVLFRSQFPVII